MRNLIAFIFLFIFLFQEVMFLNRIDVEEIPPLMQHFEFHREQSGNPTFLEFFYMHYNPFSTHRQSGAEHENLPRFVQVLFQYLITSSAIDIKTVYACKPVMAAIYADSYQYNFSQEFFIPPKC